MVDFHCKKLILEHGILQGKKTFLTPTPQLNNEIISLFSTEELYQIFNNTSKRFISSLNHKPWNVFLELHSKTTKQKFGFLWIIINDDLKLDLSIHGGGWNSSLANGILYTDSWKTILNFLFENFNTIRTSCKKNNPNAKRFIEKTSFGIEKEDLEFYYFLYKK
jgi:hypothetical protein